MRQAFSFLFCSYSHFSFFSPSLQKPLWYQRQFMRGSVRARKWIDYQKSKCIIICWTIETKAFFSYEYVQLTENYYYIQSALISSLTVCHIEYVKRQERHRFVSEVFPQAFFLTRSEATAATIWCVWDRCCRALIIKTRSTTSPSVAFLLCLSAGIAVQWTVAVMISEKVVVVGKKKFLICRQKQCQMNCCS